MKNRPRHLPLAPPPRQKIPPRLRLLLRPFHATTTARPTNQRLEIGLQPNGLSLKVSNDIRADGSPKPFSHINEQSNLILLITTPNTISSWQLRTIAILSWLWLPTKTHWLSSRSRWMRVIISG